MAREQYIFETNTINGGFLVDRRTNQIVGTTANGVDQYFVTGDRNPVTGGISFQVSGVDVPLGVGITQSSSILDIVPVNDTALWITDKTAALTVAVDNTVLFEGRPTLKITIPAGTSGACKVGCSGADANLPYFWDRENFSVAMMYGGFTGYDFVSTFPPKLDPYIGNATYTNFWTASGYNGATFTELKTRNGEWCVSKPTAAQWQIGSGTPISVLGDGTKITAAKARCKLQWTQVSQATDCYIWVGLFGKLPARKKPTIIFTLDDGYSSWNSFIAPLFKHYDMPVSMGIDSAFVGTANYLTQSQIVSLYSDQSRLFDFVNHGVNNQNYSTLGAASYYQTIETTRHYLQGIGIKGDGPYHHPYVQSVWGNDLVDLMVAGGYLSARASTNVIMHGRDQVIKSDKLRWLLNIDVALISTKTLAQANADLDTAIAGGGFIMINAHDFLATAATTYQWPFSDMQQFVGRIAALRDAGTVEVKSWSRWYADLTGRFSDRR